VYRKLARSRHFTHALSSALPVILLSDIVYKHVEKRGNDKRGKITAKAAAAAAVVVVVAAVVVVVVVVLL